MDTGALSERIAEMLGGSSADQSPFELERSSASGNNRVFVVSVGERRLVAKCYYRSDEDPRDRLLAEWSFLSFARDVGVRCVPRPVSCNRDANLALYEFVEGSKVEPGSLSRADIESAVEFFLALNASGAVARATALPTASEACFRIADHFTIVDRRLARLAQIEMDTPLGNEAADLVGRLVDYWRTLKRRLCDEARARGISVDASLTAAERCVSPSDFGFHNALRDASGVLRFLDFEYAGWDDPAKMIVDFFCQPAVPVNSTYFEWFLERTAAFADDPESLMARARLLRPVFRIKWCCIMLNEFDPESAGRRRFARPGLDESQRRRAQLEKTRRAYQTLKEEG